MAADRKNKKKAVFKIPAPIMYDSDNTYSNDLSYKLEDQGTGTAHQQCKRVGLVYEDPKQYRITYLLEYLIWGNWGGTPQRELHFKLEQMGANFSSDIRGNFLYFNIQVSPVHFRKAFDLIKDVYADYTWTRQEVELEKSNLIYDIQNKSEPSFNKRAENDYFKGTPLDRSTMGNASTIKKLSLKAIHAWKERVINQANACFVITGNFIDENLAYAKERLKAHKIKRSHFSL